MALVTGATSGIGKEVARDLANRYCGINFGVSCFDFKKIFCIKEALPMLNSFGFLFHGRVFNIRIESVLIKSFIGFIIFQGLHLL